MTIITITIADGDDRTVEDDVELTVTSTTPAPSSETDVTPAWAAMGLMVGAAMTGASAARVIHAGDIATQEPGHVH